MKICFIFEGIPHYYVHILDEINKVHELSVIIPKKDDYFESQGIKSSEEGTFKRYYLEKKNAYYQKDFFKNFKSTISTIQPDILIIPWPFHLQLVFNPFLYFFLKRRHIKIGTKEIPFFVPKYNESLSKFKSKCVESMLSEKMITSKYRFLFTKIIRRLLYSLYIDFSVNYITEGKDILNSYGLDKKKIFTTYNSHNTTDTLNAISLAKKQYNIKKIKNRIVHVGRLVKWKRVDLLITAIAKMRSRDIVVELLVIGNGPELEHLKSLVKKLDLDNQVVFLGAIYDKVEMAKHLLSCEVYVLAGMGGLSLNEAMCHSLPIICSTCDGTEKDLVYEDHNGYFFKSDNLDSLVSTIEKMLLDKKQLVKFGQNSLNIIQEKINEKLVVKNYLEVFNKLK